MGKRRGGGVHEVAFNFWNYQNIFKLPSHLWFPGDKSELDELALDAFNGSNLQVLDTLFHPDFGLLTESYNLINKCRAYDIIHQHGIWLPTSFVSVKSKTKFNTKIIVQPHGYLEPYSLKRSRLKKIVNYWLFEKQNLEKCDVLLACSLKEMNNLRYYFPEKDIAVIPNGITRSFFDAKPTENYFADSRFKKKKNLLFLSRIHQTKGLERLIKAYADNSKLNKDWNLIIAGSGSEYYIKSLVDYVDHLSLNDMVFFEGPVFNQSKINLLYSADLFVLPTFTENFGIVVVEALAKGLPVITTKSAPWSDLEDYNCGLWVDDSEDGIKNGIEKAISLSETDLKRMSQNGKKLVAEKYLWENIVEQTVDLYQWMLTKRNKPSFVYEGDPLKKGKSIY